MLCDYNPKLQTHEHVDGINFTADDPCLWVTYPAGAAGDLLIAILDKHYLRTGCEYYGINDHGKIMLRTSDCESIDMHLRRRSRIDFDDQWFWDFADNLANRNMTYSMLDQVIFGCHMNRPEWLTQILAVFRRAKIINIYAQDPLGLHILNTMAAYKLRNLDPGDNIIQSFPERDFVPMIYSHDRVCNVPFGCLFDRGVYDRWYEIIRRFLGLDGALISFDFIDFYLSKQLPVIARTLKQYSQSL